MKNYTVKIISPFGEIFINFNDNLITEIKLGKFKDSGILKLPGVEEKKISKVIEEFRNYFKGKREDFNFSKKIIDYEKLTDFQKRVFKELLKVKWGNVITYSELAERLGNKNLRRMVGQALAKNPFPVIIPCHRVVGKKGLIGFSAGLEWKRKLLELEGIKISF